MILSAVGREAEKELGIYCAGDPGKKEKHANMEVMMIAMIAAVAKNRVIGCKGRIPWNIPEDMERFRRLTMGHVIIMGRHTYEEIGRPLPGRFTYLVSSRLKVETENCRTVASLREAILKAGKQDVFICGGAKLYEEAMAAADRLYITELESEVPGDVLFPVIDKEVFHETERIQSGAGYSFVTYERTVPLCCGDRKI